MEVFRVKHKCPLLLYNVFVRVLLTLFNHFSMKFFQSLYLATWLGL